MTICISTILGGEKKVYSSQLQNALTLYRSVDFTQNMYWLSAVAEDLCLFKQRKQIIHHALFTIGNAVGREAQPVYVWNVWNSFHWYTSYKLIVCNDLLCNQWNQKCCINWTTWGSDSKLWILATEDNRRKR